MTKLNDTDVRLNRRVGSHPGGGRRRPSLLRPGLSLSEYHEALTQPGDLFYDPAFGWGLWLSSPQSEKTTTSLG